MSDSKIKQILLRVSEDEKKQIEELKEEREEDRKHYREWIEGMNRTLQLLNDEKENLLERNNVLSIELEEQKNKTFLKRLKGLFK